ncbi:2OG-Fe(II) oxygenase [Phenylobacterium sp.]|uniref:2OG-Fe(II) oxygenase n=1 Tax=Phenylobacterium sp. TaxID=1871053 RepID=UPI002735528E|nr:2OG-Fe(II) oxygenase [Phenylobacterium sp.]MDP3658897.1 2OG-Fe(II) oxygenase [Phenylobacterium sp.]
MSLILGEPAPWFTAATPSNPEFALDTAGGRFVLLCFLPPAPEARGPAMRAVAARQALFDDARACVFFVVPQAHQPGARDLRGLRWFLDEDGAVGRLYGGLEADGSARPRWVLLDPSMRVLSIAPIDRAEAVIDQVAALPAPGDHAGVALHAPALVVPRVLEPELCAQLIALHEADGGAFTGVMRDIDGRTVAVMDEAKSRRDIWIHDEAWQVTLHGALESRLFPMLQRAFQFEAAGIERYLVSRYAAEEGGVFRAHRDNTTRGTAHRRFACTINLNDDYEGGDLRFPEFGPGLHRAPVGGAVVFSCSLLHEVTPLTHGRRYAFLPFFYDAAGAGVLADYRATLTEGDASQDQA